MNPYYKFDKPHILTVMLDESVTAMLMAEALGKDSERYKKQIAALIVRMLELRPDLIPFMEMYGVDVNVR